MKIQMTFKEPDLLHVATDLAAVQEVEAMEGLRPTEYSAMAESRSLDAYAAITERWMPYGEFVTVEFDTEENTARVVSRDELEGR